jgi:AAA+ superfamily predicted ATPase
VATIDHRDSHAVEISGFEQASELDLILARVRLRARRRVAWLGHLWGRDQTAASERNLVMALDDRDTPEAEAVWYASAEEIQDCNRQLARVEHALEGERGLRLRQLQDLFRLAPPELDLLQTCLASKLDPDLGPVYGYLQPHSGRPYATEALAARLFGYGRQSMWNPGSPLAVWRLVTTGEAAPGESAPLGCDPQVHNWLQGDLSIDAPLVGIVQEVKQQQPLSSWPVEETVHVIRRAVVCNAGMRVLLVGPAGIGRRTFAAAVAARLGIPTLAIDTSGIADADWPDAFIRVQRLAILANAALVWHGSGLGRRWPRQVVPAPLQFVAGDEAYSIPPCEHLIDHRITMPMPTLDERRALWAKHIPEFAAWPRPQREALVARHRLTVGDILAVSQRQPTDAQHASVMCREVMRHRLGDLGQLLDCPFTWDDIVVPDKLREDLEDFAFEAKERSAFWEAPKARRLFPRGTSLVGLLTGPPGTGKTMAAQVIAADLELDIFRIDLATVVSKYIGETAKNLKQIFSRATHMNAVLLFDEADALFSKRTDVKDAHDRYANADTNYLLQLLEDYQGIALLATNKKANIDPAFTRRVRYVLDFPRPDVDQRHRIWRQVLEEMGDPEAFPRLEKGLAALSHSVEMSGAQIKNAVLASLFVARRSQSLLDLTHLLRGVERELRKEGRALGKHEQERLKRYG